MHEDDVAYICKRCGEAFAPMDDDDWKSLRRMHAGPGQSDADCPGASFTKTTVGKAF